MLESKVTRGVAIVVLLGILFGLTVWYGSLQPAPQGGPFTDAEMLVQGYTDHIGDRVTVAGWVVRTDPIVIRVEADDEVLRLTVTHVGTAVSVGQELRVFGVAKGGRTVQAIDAVVVPGRGLGYAYSVSFLAGLWVLWRIRRHWEFDRVEGGLRPRLSPDREGSEEGVPEAAGSVRDA